MHIDENSIGRVLIADDDAELRVYLSHVLKEEGFEVIEARNGTDALKKVHENHPDLVVLDVLMPGKDGFEVCRELRKEPEFKETPIIFISGRSQQVDRVEGLEMGAVDYITKPFDNREIRARIRNLMTIGRLNRSMKILVDRLNTRQKRLQEDLKAAAKIQKSLIPKEGLGRDEFTFAWRFEPCEDVGGDIFNIVDLDESHVAMYMLDVSGHGVPSAMLAVSVAQLMSTQMGSLLKHRIPHSPRYKLNSPAEVLTELNSQFSFEQFEKYFTICYVLINLKTGELTYSNAGHPPPFVLRSSQVVDRLEKGGPVIGADPNAQYAAGHLMLAPGDRIVLYTDGLTEVSDSTGTQFGLERLEKIIMETRSEPTLDAVAARIEEGIKSYSSGKKSEDDQTLLIAEFKGFKK